MQGQGQGKGISREVTCIEVVALDSRPLLLGLVVVLIFVGFPAQQECWVRAKLFYYMHHADKSAENEN
jgi:hypothetical protein